MKNAICLLLTSWLLLALASFASAQQPVIPYARQPGSTQLNSTEVDPYNPLSVRSGGYGIGTGAVAPAYCQITSLSSAKNLVTANCASGSILANATIAQICVEAQAIRYTSSGVVTPTSTVGMPVAAGTCFPYSGPLTTVQFIQQTSGAILNVETFP